MPIRKFLFIIFLLKKWAEFPELRDVIDFEGSKEPGYEVDGSRTCWNNISVPLHGSIWV